MKRQCSALVLAARSSLTQVGLILAGMAVLQLALAGWRLWSANPAALEDVLATPFSWISALALALVMASLMWRSGGGGSRVDYTVSRLSLSPVSLTLWYTLYGVIVLFLFWAVQLGVVLVLALVYPAMMPTELYQPQFFLFAAYRSGYLHTLLPLGDWGRWISSLVFPLLLAPISALGVRNSWMGRRTLWPLVLTLLTGIDQGGIGDSGWNWILVAAAAIGLLVEITRGREEERP